MTPSGALMGVVALLAAAPIAEARTSSLTLSGTQTVRLAESSSWQVSQLVGAKLVACTYDRRTTGRATYRFSLRPTAVTTPAPGVSRVLQLRVDGTGRLSRVWRLAADQDGRCSAKPLEGLPEAPQLRDVQERCSITGVSSRVRLTAGRRFLRFRSRGDGETGDDLFEDCHQLGPTADFALAIRRRYATSWFGHRAVDLAGRSVTSREVPDLDAVAGNLERTARTTWQVRFARRG